MKNPISLAVLLERFFAQRLMQQRQASPHTIGSYRDTFSQFLKFSEQRLKQAPSRLSFHQIDAPLITAFLDYLENQRSVSIRSRNLRLTALRSFFRFAAFEAPTHSAQIQRVLAIPSKRFTRTLVEFLTRAEVDALLAAPDQNTWLGRRDHAFILVAVQTGLRLSEMTGLKREDIILGAGAHVRVIGKGRKERCTPVAKSTLAVLKAWLREPQRGNGQVLFPSIHGQPLSVHGVQYMLNKHRVAASSVCTSLKDKRVTVHRLSHTMAMDLLQAGVDRSVFHCGSGTNGLKPHRSISKPQSQSRKGRWQRHRHSTVSPVATNLATVFSNSSAVYRRQKLCGSKCHVIKSKGPESRAHSSKLNPAPDIIRKGT